MTLVSADSLTHGPTGDGLQLWVRAVLWGWSMQSTQFFSSKNLLIKIQKLLFSLQWHKDPQKSRKYWSNPHQTILYIIFKRDTKTSDDTNIPASEASLGLVDIVLYDVDAG